MDVKILLLCLLYLVHPCHGRGWDCGGTKIKGGGESQSLCLCGNENITSKDYYNDRTNCCGPDTCTITEFGATCPGGQTCTSYTYTWPCGDLQISKYKTCHCGAEQLTREDWDYPNYKFCCPSTRPSQCYMSQDGNGHCNGTVKTGEEAGCDTGVCWVGRSYFACRSGDKCVYRGHMCHGEPQCEDLSDVEFCNIHNNDVCEPSYLYNKCPATSSSEHQECYSPSEDSNKSEYNCLTRTDEEDVEENTENNSLQQETDTDTENIDYESIKPCTTDNGYPGLMCGGKCKRNMEWCRSGGWSRSCAVNTSFDFTSENKILCMNSTFWTHIGQDCNLYYRDGIIMGFGKRCSGGKAQHCYAPPHRKFDYRYDNTLALSCSDLSDQVHEVGSKCNIDKDVQEYCQLFCQQTLTDISIENQKYSIDGEGRKVRIGSKCDTICQNKESWISEHKNPGYKNRKDPRSCQSSCSDKGYNCNACTHPDYSFTCKINGTEHCLNPELICDGVPICDDLSDEKVLTSSFCIERLAREKAIKPEAATVICERNELHAETIAVPCNNIIECVNGEDEHWLCKNSQFSLVGAVIAFVILFIISIFMKYCHWTITELKMSMTVNFKPKKCKDVVKIQVNCQSERKYEQEIDNEPLILQNVLDSDIFNRDHDKTEFRNEVNLFILNCEELDEKQERINKNQKLYQLELKKHARNESETALCIKNTIDPRNAKILLDDAKPGIMRNHFRKMEDFQDWLGKKKTANWAMNKAKNIVTIYVDLCKDTYLMIVIYILVGGPTGSLKNFPSKLSSVVVFCQFGSIVGPLLVSGILHANDEMRRMNLSLIGKMWKYFLAILKSPLTPLFISQEYDDNKTAIRTMIHYNRHRNDVLELMAKGTRVRRSYAKFLRIDLGLELFFQLSGQLILLCLSVTETPTTGGLESFFQKADNFYFGLSIALGFRTVYMAYLKTVAVEKPYFGIIAKSVLFVWIMVSGTLRIIVLVLYFTPSFGLFSSLHHWRKEQIPFASKYRDQVNKTGMLYLYKTNITKEQWDEIDRYDYDLETGPSYSEYTIYHLDQYFIFFWIILLVHIFINIVIKLALAKPFRFETINVEEYCLITLDWQQQPIYLKGAGTQ